MRKLIIQLRVCKGVEPYQINIIGFLIALIVLLTFFALPNTALAAEPVFPGKSADETVYLDYWNKYGKYVMENAPDNIKNGSNIEKANYVMGKVGDKAGENGIKPNNSSWGRLRGAWEEGPRDRGACGDITNTLLEAFRGAGIQGSEQVNGNKTGFGKLDLVNPDHGCVMVPDGKGNLVTFDLWQHGIDAETYKGSSISKWNGMDAQKWGKEMEKQGYETFERGQTTDVKGEVKGADNFFNNIEKGEKQRIAEEKKQEEGADKARNDALAQAEAAITGCKFNEVAGILKGVANPNKPLLKIPKIKDAKDKADGLIKKTGELQKKQDDAKVALSKAEGDIKNCNLSNVESSLQSIISDDSLKACDEPGKAQDLVKKAKEIEKKKKDAENAITQANTASTNANQAAEEAKKGKEKVQEAKGKAEGSLSKARDFLNEPTNVAEKCAEAKKLAGEINLAVKNATDSAAEVEQHYQKTEDAMDKACELEEEAESIMLISLDEVEDKKELESLSGKATSTAKEARKPREKAKEKAEEAKQHAKSAGDAKSKLDALLEEISKAAKSRISKAKEELSKGLVLDEATQGVSDSTLGESNAQKAAKETLDAKNLVVSLTNECFKELIPKAEQAVTDAEAKAGEAKGFAGEAQTIKSEVEKIVNDINGELAKFSSDEGTSACDVENTADVRDARAAADEAALSAQESSDNWTEAELCASRLRQAVLTFEGGEEEEEEEPIDLETEEVAEATPTPEPTLTPNEEETPEPTPTPNEEETPEPTPTPGEEETGEEEEEPIDLGTEEVDDPGYLSGECNGTIVASPDSGYGGDPVIVTITISPPFDEVITRVDLRNENCNPCDSNQAEPGRFSRTLYYQGGGGSGYVIEFDAFDKDGKIRCSGQSNPVTDLGQKSQ